MMQPLGAVHAVGPSLVQVGHVRIEQAAPGQRGVGYQVARVGDGGVTADRFAVQPQRAADVGDGQPAGERVVDVVVAFAGPRC